MVIFMYDLQKEKREAYNAGYQALMSLKRAQQELNGARNWGIFDIVGGGFFSTMIKHSKMNNAQRYMSQAKHDLVLFSKELKDVDRYINLDFNTGDFLSFADYFWDGFVADIMVQDKINQARNQVSDAIRLVEQALYELR